MSNTQTSSECAIFDETKKKDSPENYSIIAIYYDIISYHQTKFPFMTLYPLYLVFWKGKSSLMKSYAGF